MKKTFIIFTVLLILCSNMAYAKKDGNYNGKNNLINGYQIIRVNDKYGLKNKHGNYEYNPIYSDIIPLYSKYLIFKVSDDNYFMIDLENNTAPVIRRAEEIIEPNVYKMERMIVKYNGKYGIIGYESKKSTQIIPFKYDSISSIDDTSAYYSAEINTKYAVINIYDGKEYTDFIYDEIEKLENSHYLKLKCKNKYAIFDMKTNMLTDSIFEDVRIGKLEAGSYGKNIQVKYNGKWHYIQKSKIASDIAKNAAQRTENIIVGVALVPIVLPIAVWWYFYSK